MGNWASVGAGIGAVVCGDKCVSRAGGVGGIGDGGGGGEAPEVVALLVALMAELDKAGEAYPLPADAAWLLTTA